jgi:vanillate O-demethylase monooxygenase subunit
VNENLLDLSHLTFLHGGTIGDSELAMAKLQMKETPGCLEAVRYVKSIDSGSLPAGKALGLEGPIDRTVGQQFFPPSFHITGGDYDSAAANGIDPGRHFGSIRVLHGVTPKTPTTTAYFWAFSRDFRLMPEMTKTFHGVIRSALEEDIDALNAIESLLNEEQEKIPQISTSADLASFRGRLLVLRQIQAETKTREPAPSLESVAVDSEC